MDKNFRIRLGVCFFVIALLGFGVVLRAAYLMILPSERLSTAMNRQFRQDPPRMPRRGYIVDRNREPIAVSMDVKSLFVNPNKIKNKALVAQWLAKATDSPLAVIKAKLRSEKSFIWIKRQLSENELAAVEDLLDKHPTLTLSVGLSKESKRFYPHQTLSAQLLGFTGLDSNGLEGLELFYEKDLAGSQESKIKDGSTLVLTIDKTLQYTLEEELERGRKQAGGIAATAIIMDAENGDILAMASSPSFNSNRYSATAPEYRRNRSITDTFEPGSTMKSVLVAGALENNVITPQTKVFCEWGKYQIGKHWIREAEAKDKWGWLKIGEVIQKSSNIGATKIGFLYGPENIYNWYRKMGIGEKTGIDLPGEASGFLPKVEKWSKVAHSNISFGQGLSVTPLQMVRAYAAFANGGFLVTPRLVKQLYSFEGDFQKEFPEKPKKRVLQTKTTIQLNNIMSTVTTEDGTAIKAAIPGYIVAGKTGTAQKSTPGKGYKTGKHIASFIGFVRNVKPNYVALVLVDEPKFPYFGGEAAAPIFKKIMTAALAREGISPDPSLIKPDSLPASPIGKNKIQEKISTISAAPEPPKELQVVDDRWMMPELKGLTARNVMDLFDERSVQLQLKGAGRVVEQFPRAGALLNKGDNVVIRLEREAALP